MEPEAIDHRTIKAGVEGIFHDEICAAFSYQIAEHGV